MREWRSGMDFRSSVMVTRDLYFNFKYDENGNDNDDNNGGCKEPFNRYSLVIIKCREKKKSHILRMSVSSSRSSFT